MSVDNFGISLGGSEAVFDRFKKAQGWLENRKREVTTKNTAAGKTGIVMHQEKAYQQGYLDAIEHFKILLDNLSKL